MKDPVVNDDIEKAAAESIGSPKPEISISLNCSGPEGDVPYSIFTSRQKLGIVVLVAYAGVFSPLSSFIYYPAIKAIAEDLHTSLGKINLTITSYMVISAVAPTMWGDTGDTYGRRPIFLFMFLIYIAANIGLALQGSYIALLLLRMVQSAGGSATIGIGYGVVGDIATPAERGFYMGILGCGPQVAPSLGPLFGGLLAQQASWRWIFWFLAIGGTICFLLVAIFLPETARKIVGNGSIPPQGLSKSPWSLKQKKKLKEPSQPISIPKRKITIPNPLKSAYIVFCKDTAPIIFIYAISYTNYCCLQASLSSLFISLYGFGELAAGAIYIPFGVGCFIASFISGKLLNHDYIQIARQNKLPVNDVQGQDLTHFPIEKARFLRMPVLLLFSGALTCAYGWVLEKTVHFAVALVFQFFIGGAITMIFNMCGTLLIDQHPLQPATAQASLNLVRCLLAAGGLAALQPIIDAVGVGWCYTIFAGFSLAALPLCLLEVEYGMRWRLARVEQMRI